MYRLSERPETGQAAEPRCICCLCNQPITEWPEDERFRRYCRKWKVHPQCYEMLMRKMDMESR